MTELINALGLDSLSPGEWLIDFPADLDDI